MRRLGGSVASALRSMAALRRLFVCYRNTGQEPQIRREQATILSGVIWLFAFLGIGSCVLFTLAFGQQANPVILVNGGMIIALYIDVLTCGLRWRRQRDDTAFINRCRHTFFVLGIAWGVLVNLFSLPAGPDQQGVLIGLIMGLVSTPMLTVPLSAALAYFLPISLLCTVAILLQPIQLAALFSFFGFFAFAMIGMLYMNKTILERSIGRLNLQKDHETISLFLREYQEVSSDWLWQTDRDGYFHDVSARMADVLQLDEVRRKRLSVNDFLALNRREHDDFERLTRFLRQRMAFRDMTLAVLIDGAVRYISLTGHPVHDATGSFDGFRGIGSDVTEARLGRRQVEFLARHDGLTGLLNHKAFVDELNTNCAAAGADGLAVLMVDLDDFKSINDDLGHAAGDEVLQAVADRIRGSIRPGDRGGRIGGDEFAVMLRGVQQAEALAIANRIITALAGHLLIENQAMTLRGSVGLALSPAHGNEGRLLMRRADLALYRAKDRGKNSVWLFGFELEQEHLGRIQLQTELASALDAGQILLHYLPVVDLRSGDVVACEGLPRWRHPTRGLQPVEAFLHGGEPAELTDRLDERSLHLACQAAAGWPEPLTVAVNLPSRQLRSGHLVDGLQSCLASTCLPARRLSLQISETVLLAASQQTISQLAAVRAQGVRIILDGFGTGPSALTRLAAFDIDGIRIDAGFIRDLPGSAKVAAIVRAVAGLATELNIPVIAAGLETTPQLDWLLGNGVALAQGPRLRPAAEAPPAPMARRAAHHGLLSL